MDDNYKQALEIVKAQAAVRTMTTEEITTMVKTLATNFARMGLDDSVPQEAAPTKLDPKKSIKEKSITCLECGKTFKIITGKHLATHDLNKKSYLEKHGLKKGTSLIAKGLSRDRKEKMKDMELWKKRGHTPARVKVD